MTKHVTHWIDGKPYTGAAERQGEIFDPATGQVTGTVDFANVAVMDEDGYFRIVDRLKEMIISGGYNIYPREIEEVLFQHPAVLEAAAIGVPDSYRGESAKAFVVLKPGQAATAEELIAFCKQNLAPYKVPKSIEFRETLPKTLIGKILRRELVAEEKQKMEKEKVAQ